MLLLMTMRRRFHAMEQLLGAAAARRALGALCCTILPPIGFALRVRSCVASRLVAKSIPLYPQVVDDRRMYAPPPLSWKAVGSKKVSLELLK